jgi:single-strand DNA-binding protein
VYDPELKYTQKGAAVCSFSLASNRYFKQDEETQKEVSYFDVSTWSRLAEVCGEYLKKGRGVRVVGRLKQDRWTSPEGQGRSKVSIVAEHVEFKPQLKGKDGDGKDSDRARHARIGGIRYGKSTENVIATLCVGGRGRYCILTRTQVE